MKLRRKVSLAEVIQLPKPEPKSEVKEDTRELLDMKKMTFGGILSRSEEIQSMCSDYVVRSVNSERLRLNDLAGITYVTEQGEVRSPAISKWGMGQLCNKVGVPADYMRKCIGTGRIELAQDNLNSWLEDFNKDLFIREYNGTIRGVLTPRYSVCDTPTILNTMKNSFPVDDFNIKGYFLNEERLHIRLVSPHQLPIDSEDLYPGFSIDSSDVGRSNLTINFFIWKKVCTNGLIVPKRFGVLFHQRHRGITIEDFALNLENAMDLVNPIIDKVTESIVNTSGVSLESAFKNEDSLNELIHRVRSQTLMPEDGVKKVIQLMTDGVYEKTRWGLINSITQVAQDFTLDKRVEYERAAGGMLVA